MTAIQQFILWGSSGHAKVLGSLIKSRGGVVIALFDNDPHAISAFPDVPLYIGVDGFVAWREKQVHPDVYGLAAMGGARGSDRLEIHDLFRRHNIKIKSVIHPDAAVCSTAVLGVGTQVMAQAVVSSDASLGEACIINHGAVVEHECELGAGVHLAPHATLCGCVTVGGGAMIGAGAVVLPRLTIGSHAIVGAGAVVTKNLPSNVIVVGNPARIISSDP